MQQEHRGSRAEYHYRRKLSAAEFLPAVGAALGAGVIVFYLTSLLLQRTPLVPERSIAIIGPRPARTRRPVSRTDGG